MFHMSGEKYGGFSIPEVLCWYLESIGLSGSDYLCPRFRGSKSGKVEPLRQLPGGYSTSATQLKQFCVNNRIDNLTLHSGRRRAATQAKACGVERSKIKLCGGWSSSAVDKYFHPVRPGLDFSRRVLCQL